MKASMINLLVFVLLPGFAFASELPSPEYRNIAPGVWYGEVKEKDPPIVYHVIKVDTGADKVEIRPLRPRDDETLGQVAARIDSEEVHMLGAITADYYHYLRDYKLVIPWGILVQEGELLFSPGGKSALCSETSGLFYISVPTMKALIRNSPATPGVRITAVNRQIKSRENKCGIYNSRWGDVAPEISEGYAVTVTGDPEFRIDRTGQGTITGISRLPVKVPIPEDGFIMIMEKLPPSDQLDLKLGSQVMLDIEVSSSPENAVGGGPRILRNGKISIELTRENFGSGHAFYIKSSRHPRSAVGINPDWKMLFLVVVEGRSDRSQGMNLRELSRLLISLGATEAMAFDGGRSVSMYVDGKEAVKGDRQIADALGVFQIIK